ncbi:restriction endonuclease subunit S [Streptomyces sp. NBC_00425]|uniref:restriction endonuclease subunit S n=1 Tax=Streptomyces sp. NBC_00425 TaxID=2975740 RepID=UPI002E20E745
MKELFQIPPGWQWEEFRNVARVVSDLVKPQDYPNASHIAPNHIEAKTGRLLPYSTVAADGVSSVKNRFYAGQILYSKIRPYLAKAALVDFDGVCSADMYPINTELDPGYLHRWMLTPEFTAAAAQNQGRNLLPKINVKELSSLPVPVPPAFVQKQIAALLDQVDALREMRRKAIALLDDFTQSNFIDMFGDRSEIYRRWPKARLGEMLEFLTSGSRGWAAHYVDEPGSLFLRIQNVRGGELLLDDVAYVNPPDTAEARRTQVQPGDVLLSITADLGRTAVVPGELDQAFINQHLSILRTTSLNPHFLSAFLESPFGHEKILGRNRQGVKAGLNFDDVRSLETPCPPIELQEEFAKRIKLGRELRELHRAHLAELDGLFACLQHRAFRGELWPGA